MSQPTNISVAAAEHIRDNGCHLDDHSQLINEAAIGPNENVLDLGCGTGEMVHMIAPHTTGHVWGIDQNPEFLLAARAKIALADAGRVYFLEGDVTTMTKLVKKENTSPEQVPIVMPNPNIKFDVVLASWLLNDLHRRPESLPSMIKALHPITKPTTRFVFDWCWSQKWMGKPISAAAIIWSHSNPLQDRYRLSWGVPEYNEACRKEFKNVIEKLGLVEKSPIISFYGLCRFSRITEGLPRFIALGDEEIMQFKPPNSQIQAPTPDLKRDVQRFGLLYDGMYDDTQRVDGATVEMVIDNLLGKPFLDQDLRNNGRRVASGRKFWEVTKLCLAAIKMMAYCRFLAQHPNQRPNLNELFNYGVKEKTYQAVGVFQLADPTT